MKNVCQKFLSRYQEFTNQINQCETSYDLLHALRRICENYQCNNFMVSELPMRGEILLNEVMIVNNWDPEVIRAYDLALKEEISKLLDLVRLSVNPVYWKLPVHSDELHGFGDEPVLETCIFFPVFDRTGRKGMIGFSDCSYEDDLELIALGLIANLVFDKIVDLKHANITHASTLSEREIQCLNWTALGKTSFEIGKILEISTNTVNHYLSNASRKLNCVNKTHAVAKCIQDGIIHYPRNIEQAGFIY